MLKQGTVDWTLIDKQGRGGGDRDRNKIHISIHRNRKKPFEALSISVPIGILTSAGMKYGDFAEVFYCDGICKINRTNSNIKGYKVSGRANSRGRISMTIRGDEMKKAFFPHREDSYFSPDHETRSNSIQFLIGKDAIEDEA